MTTRHDEGVPPRTTVLRKWAIRLVIALVAFQVFYVIAANIFIRSEILPRIINKKPEKQVISWDSASTFLPGVAKVEGFTMLSQTRRDQIYIHVAEAKARISLLKLAMKTIHIRGVDAKDVDFRYRQRVDRPPKKGQDEPPHIDPEAVQYYPDIPGFSNPPDPRPEDLYPMKKKKRPWTIKITGAHVDGPIRVALNEIRITGDGFAGGGVTVKPRDSITIHRGKLGLEPATVVIGPETVTDDLMIHADVRIGTFPAKGAKAPDVLGGLSGELKVAGNLGDVVAVSRQITPGISVGGAGALDADLQFKRGILQTGSTYSLQSDHLILDLMQLHADGKATVSGGTVEEDGDHITNVKVAFDDFQFFDPDGVAVDVMGSGLELDARFNGLSIGEWVPAEHVTLLMPSTQIGDISVFNALFPEDSTLVFDSGTGDINAAIEVSNRVAQGSLDLVADEIVLTANGTPIYGDLEVHAQLAEGDLTTGQFDFSGTTIKVDDIVGEDLTKKQQRKFEPWFCNVILEQGEITFGKPMAATGKVDLSMYDTRPMVALLKDMGASPKWLSLMPNIKNVDGSAAINYGKGYMEIDDLNLTGEGLLVEGTIHSRDKKTDGRLFIKLKGIAAGIGINQSKAKIHLTKPRKWFEAQQAASGSPVQ